MVGSVVVPALHNMHGIQLVETQRFPVLEEQLSQLVEPFDRIGADAVAVGPFIVARCVGNRFRIRSKEIANLAKFVVGARRALRLEVANVYQEGKILACGFLEKTTILNVLVL